MRPTGRRFRRAIVLALACAAAACGGGEATPVHVVDPTPVSFSGANLDLDRPCTLLTANDAADISGLPFYRTLAANLIEEGHIRCAQGVGAYGLHGVVEADMQLVDAGVAHDAFSRECRVMARQQPRPPLPVIPPPAAYYPEGGFGEAHMDAAVLLPAPAAAAPVPSINGEYCVLAGGAYALLLPDRMLVLRVRQSAGEVDAEASRRLASLVSYRLTSN